MTVRVLLIDDNLPDRVRYRRMLQRGGDAIDITEVDDAGKGLALLAVGSPAFDCVLLDQDLPDMQGLDVLEDIRQRADAPPVVMLTGEEDAAVSIEALHRGAADYLMKRRIDEDRLQRAVRGAIERHLLERQLREQQQRLSRFYRLTSQTEDALFIVEAETARITDCNDAARTRLGLKPFGEAGSDGREVPAAFGDAKAWRDFCQQAEAEGSARYEWQHPQAGSEALAMLEISARRIEEDGRPYIVAIGRDISLRKQREQELLERALRDGLTGIWNRRAFDERLAESWRAAQRNGRPLAAILIDVDHFKFYNDLLGHPAGDECLRQVAQALSGGVLRSHSLFARYGGEEFVALLEDADIEAARSSAERLRQTVQGLGLEHPRSSIASHVTISLGVASLVPDAASDPKKLLDAADAALYKAKRNGRNRVFAEGDAEGLA